MLIPEYYRLRYIGTERSAVVAKGMLKVWVLKLLSQGPRTGYDLIKEMEQRIGWQPSPGSVYPLLQMLGEAGLLKARPEGNKVYWELTAEGRRHLEELWKKRREWLEELGVKEQAVWQAFDDPDHPFRIFPHLARLAWKAASRGKGRDAVRILEEARDRLEELLEGK